MSVEFQQHYVYFQEFSTQGRVLDTESGWINGSGIRYQVSHNNQHHFSLSILQSNGTLDYDGHTQGGTPHNTQTKESYTALIGDYFSTLSLWSNYQLGLSLAEENWDRKIQPNNGVLGLFEYYQWHSIGILQNYQYRDFKISLKLSKLFNATMDVDLVETSGVFVHVPLNGGRQAELSIIKEFHVSDSLLGYITLASKWRYFPVSKGVQLNSSIVLEPENELFQFTTNIGLSYCF